MREIGTKMGKVAGEKDEMLYTDNNYNRLAFLFQITRTCFILPLRLLIDYS